MSKSISSLLNTNKATRWLVIVLLIVFAYFIGSRAIDTGSLQQYALTLVAMIVAGKLFADGVNLKRNGNKQ